MTAGWLRWVILCSPSKRNLTRLEKLVTEELGEAGREQVLLLEPEKVLLELQRMADESATGQTRVKG